MAACDEGETIGSQLQQLAARLERGCDVEPRDIALVEQVSHYVGFKAPLAARSIKAEMKAHVDQLLGKWRRGAMETTKALKLAHEADLAGDQRRAQLVLSMARDRIGMPFYADILETELQRLSAENEG